MRVEAHCDGYDADRARHGDVQIQVRETELLHTISLLSASLTHVCKPTTAFANLSVYGVRPAADWTGGWLVLPHELTD